MVIFLQKISQNVDERARTAYPRKKKPIEKKIPHPNPKKLFLVLRSRVVMLNKGLFLYILLLITMMTRPLLSNNHPHDFWGHVFPKKNLLKILYSSVVCTATLKKPFFLSSSPLPPNPADPHISLKQARFRGASFRYYYYSILLHDRANCVCYKVRICRV